ncbi:hypothetical protein AAEO56_09460 [Flavobacterium sp. DGU11]|uniref:Uncharacterized protein n=1 Tax=Flavobacterium arundinis TaxID=3139143 RepID=A0ABU9HWE7_9FLAO
MKPRKFINYEKESLIKLIKSLQSKFDSHEFITLFSEIYKTHYDNFLNLYMDDSHRKVHQQIALGLVDNMDYFKIDKNGKVKSLNIFGFNNKNEEWIKL